MIRVLYVAILALVLAFASANEPSPSDNGENGPGVMARQFLDSYQQYGAVCIDGSPAGYYLQLATDPANANNWQIHFEGGGWCYNEDQCYDRSFSDLGSSVNWPATKEFGGLLSGNCDVNPQFCTWNRVYFAYCDGNSFTGMRDGPVNVKGKDLYFRGRSIIDAVIDDIKLKHNFNNAANVQLSGCSAGGLATYLNADYLGAKLPSTVDKYRAVPISGFFLDAPNPEGEYVYREEMQGIFELANSTYSLNEKCVADMDDENKWKCNFADHSLPYIQTPIFLLNSQFDSWSTGCILGAEMSGCGASPGWGDCSQHQEQCTDDQIHMYNNFASSVQSVVKEAMTDDAWKSRNGAFLHACHTHCAGIFDWAWTGFNIVGDSKGRAMRDAVAEWWNGDAGSDVYLMDCFYNESSSPRMCNPVCGTNGAVEARFQ